MPQLPPMPVKQLCIEDWRAAIKSARKPTMRGSDGWSVQELQWLSDDLTHLLLRIFQAAESGVISKMAGTIFLLGPGSAS